MPNGKIIEPRVLKGFRDSMPENEIRKKAIIAKLEEMFSSYGFVPIDTPVLEYTEVLLGKGGGETDKQIFHFKDNGEREVAMRFDLTVPFARFMAAHLNELPLPFKRFHIDKVWRGENPQKGRFREFTQCDFDIVGVDNAEADFEILSMMDSSFSMLGIQGYTFHIAHRGLFNAFLSHLGVEEKAVEILREVDKLRKVGADAVKQSLTEITSDAEKAEAVMRFITKEDQQEPFLETLARLATLAGGENEHTGRMRKIYGYLESAQIANHFIYDPSITRGLDYYTGIVYETFLDGLDQFGSVCSGGRYNNLASLYTKQELPGVGSSIGLDRLMAALGELDSKMLGDSRAADVLVMVMDEGLRPWYNGLATRMRRAGLHVDLYLPEGKKMGAQFKYAELQHIPFALTCGGDEHAAGKVSLKDLRSRETKQMITLDEAVKTIKEGLA
ncbi:MAG: histidine--tRNA ligase [Sphaerochaetaceae bacterium]|nr:histidine--tRNA ligase [Spirochaetales bacterium]MDY5500136.1 histidine--tRNA ligase [Sphaerochaetaceae bacterium]